MPEAEGLFGFFFFKNEENFPRSLSGPLLIGQNCVTCPTFNQSLTRGAELQFGTEMNQDLHPDTPAGSTLPEPPAAQFLNRITFLLTKD